MTRDMTLSQATLGTDGLLRKALLVLGGSAFIAIAAQISVPMFPVPMTLQMLAILLVGFAYGSKLGAATVLAYLAEGLMGLPVFANAMNGAAFAGPTAGFLIGFVAVAYVAGLAAERGVAKGFVGTAVAAIFASALVYIPGVIWPMAVASSFGIEGGWVGIGWDKIWAWFMGPFLIGDTVKALIAALIVSGAWKVLRKA
ncbi:MAG: biotin transporter BioY [Dinoroseobacter sp.]|nr:biotin transporter BioY [Dinoroseobacter sp.]MDJ0995443.1 biotin transporter BioY [Dinoroseobacter sp.]